MYTLRAISEPKYAPKSMGGFLEIGAGNLWTLVYRITAMKLYCAIYLNVVNQLNCTNVVAVRGIIFVSHEIVFIISRNNLSPIAHLFIYLFTYLLSNCFKEHGQ